MLYSVIKFGCSITASIRNVYFINVTHLIIYIELCLKIRCILNGYNLEFCLKVPVRSADAFIFCVSLTGSSCSSSRQNLTLSLSSTKDKGSQSCNYPNGGLLSRYSGSAQSLGSVRKAYIVVLLLSLLCLLTYLLLA